MGLLQYKSNEMFSSTELIRKSKMVFNKILDGDIEKAIILRDGKPTFLLIDFHKYETIMSEFEELQEYVESIDNKAKKETEKPQKIKKYDLSKKKKSKKKKDKKPEIVVEPKKVAEPKKIKKVQPFAVVPPQVDLTEKKVVIEEEEIVIPLTERENQFSFDIKKEKKAIEPLEKVALEVEIESKKEIEVESEPDNAISEEEEIQTALKTIEGINFDDEMKQIAESKIKEKIVQARAMRKKIEEEERELRKEEEREELALQQKIEKEKRDKQKALLEFWD